MVAANPAPVAIPEPAAAPAPAPVATPAPAPVAKPAPVHVAKPAPKPVAKPVMVAAAEPPPEVKVAAAPPSNTVGAVKQIDPITDTNATGAGAVAGGVLGGVGHQRPGQRQEAMTLLGAVGGAVAGHQVEKAVTTKVIGYRVQVQLDNGETRSFEAAQLDGLKVGDRVRVEQGQLRRV